MAFQCLVCFLILPQTVLAVGLAKDGKGGRAQSRFLQNVVDRASDGDGASLFAEVIEQQIENAQSGGLRGEVATLRIEYLQLLSQTPGAERGRANSESLPLGVDEEQIEKTARQRNERIRLLSEKAVLELLIYRRLAYEAPSEAAQTPRATYNSSEFNSSEFNRRIDAALSLALQQNCLLYATSLHALVAKDSCQVGEILKSCDYAIRSQALARNANDRGLQISADRLLLGCMGMASKLENALTRWAALRVAFSDASGERSAETILDQLLPEDVAIASEKARRILAAVGRNSEPPGPELIHAAAIFALAEIHGELTNARRQRFLALTGVAPAKTPLVRTRLDAETALTLVRTENYSRALEIAKAALIDAAPVQGFEQAIELAIVGQIASIRLDRATDAEHFAGLAKQNVSDLLSSEKPQNQELFKHQLNLLASWTAEEDPSADALASNLSARALSPGLQSASLQPASLGSLSKAEQWIVPALAIGLVCCLSIAVVGWTRTRRETRRLKAELAKQSNSLEHIQGVTGSLGNQSKQLLDSLSASLREPLQAISLASRCVIASKGYEQSLLGQLQTIHSGSQNLLGMLESWNDAAGLDGFSTTELLDESPCEFGLTPLIKDAVKQMRAVQPGSSYRLCLEQSAEADGRLVRSYPKKLSKLLLELGRLAGVASEHGDVLVDARCSPHSTFDDVKADLLVTFTIQRSSSRPARNAPDFESPKTRALVPVGEGAPDSANPNSLSVPDEFGWAEQGVIDALVRLLEGCLTVHRDSAGITCLVASLGVEVAKVQVPKERACETALSIPTDGQTIACVIDDDPLVLESTVATLKALGCECVACGSWPAAQRALESQRCDMVVTDINMPSWDGFDVLAEVRAMPETRRPIIVALSGETDPSMVDRIQSAGFDAVVFKPYSLAEMSELLRSLTRRVHEL